MPLTDRQIQAAKPDTKPFKLADGRGLCLLVTPTGSKLWRYRFNHDGRETMMALGDYPRVSLAAAREAADDARRQVKAGIHPAQARAIAAQEQAVACAQTFQAVAEAWLAHRSAKWRGRRAKQLGAALAAHVYPTLGALPIAAIRPATLIEVVRDLADRPAQAVAVRQAIRAVFAYAVVHGHVERDPSTYLASGDVLHAYTPTHHRRLENADEIKKLLAGLSRPVPAGQPGQAVALVCRVLLLVATRPSELREASWSEFDLDAATWVIPAERTKRQREHRVPLSTQAVALLRDLHALTGHRDHLLPNRADPRRPAAVGVLNRGFERSGAPTGFSAHGARGTFSTWAHETGWRTEVVERQLAHVDRNATRRSYNAAEYWAERCALMQAWADHLDVVAAGAAGNVININAGRAAA